MKKHWPLVITAMLLGGGLVLLAALYVPRYGTDIVAGAVASPLGYLSLGLMIGGAVLLVPALLLVRRLINRKNELPAAERPGLSRLGDVLRDEGGTAAFEALLVMPFLVLILTVMLQAVLMWNANMVVHYAGFATTRAAVTIVGSPCHGSVTGTSVSQDFEDRYMVNNPDDPYHLKPPSWKLIRIHRAAALQLTQISGRMRPGSSPDNEDPEMRADDLTDFIRSALNIGGGDADQGWINHVADQYTYAFYNSKVILEQPWHWRGESNRDETCPYRNHKPDLNDWSPEKGYNSIPFCPNYTHTWDFGWWEPMNVTLQYDFPLYVPIASRMLYLVGQSGMVQTKTLPGRSEVLYFVPIDVTMKL